jgi:hypothetical protein
VQSDVQIEQGKLGGANGPEQRIARWEAELLHAQPKTDEIVRAWEQGVANALGLRRRDVVLGHTLDVKERARKCKPPSWARR